MTEKTLDFYQIYYKDSQSKEIYDFAKPYFNESFTPYFENSVITSLVPKSKADLISVVSWKLRHKRSLIQSESVLRLTGSFELTKKKILETEFDVANLTPRISEHKMLFMAQNWHGQVWIDSFALLSSFLRSELGISVPEELNYPIYGNHFIARGEIYRNYVSSCLIPTIQFMESEGEIFTKDSGYRILKERTGDLKAIIDYEKAAGRKDWMIGVFLLERLFSIWINERGLNVINL